MINPHLPLSNVLYAIILMALFILPFWLVGVFRKRIENMNLLKWPIYASLAFFIGAIGFCQSNLCMCGEGSRADRTARLNVSVMIFMGEMTLSVLPVIFVLGRRRDGSVS